MASTEDPNGHRQSEAEQSKQDASKDKAVTGNSRDSSSETLFEAPNEGPTQPLLQPYTMGEFQLSTRMVYAPLTRCRALDTVPQPSAVLYYSQRAIKGGFMLSEGTVIGPHGHGYPNTPGIYEQRHVDGWKPVVEAVHDKGAIFFLQLWHVGRVSHAVYQPDDKGPLAPSAIAAEGELLLPDGSTAPFAVPRALTLEQIGELKQQFVVGARNALAAGFDGVEIHSAHGYVLENFLKKISNVRTDEYGGSIENRCRFVLEVVDAVIAETGNGKVGIRFSPFSAAPGSKDSITEATFTTYMYLLEELNQRDGLLYVHFVEPRWNQHIGVHQAQESATLEPFRMVWRGGKGTFITAGGYDRENGNKALREGHADLIVFGRKWLSNPDLPERFRLSAGLNEYDRDTFYSSEQKEGYIDYPYLEEETKEKLESALTK